MSCREKSEHQQRVEEFMRGAGQEVKSFPDLPGPDVRLLRAKLILEEALETIEALGFKISVSCLEKFARSGLKITNTELVEVYEPDLVGIADGCGDLSVVTIGTMSACGIADISVLGEIDKANMRKVGPGSLRRPDGKVLKPKDFVPADVGRILELQKDEYKGY